MDDVVVTLPKARVISQSSLRRTNHRQSHSPWSNVNICTGLQSQRSFIMHWIFFTTVDLRWYYMYSGD